VENLEYFVGVAMKISLFILFFSFFPSASFLFGQQNDYSRVDSIMRNYHTTVKTLDDLYKVVYFIRKNFVEDSLRLRASFIWITENISYDIKSFKTGNPNASRLDYIIKNKKAVCGGYSALLKSFCDYFNIESKIVNGKARSLKSDINIASRAFKSDHSWNMVKISEQWRLIDATWAAGSIDDIEKPSAKFYKKYEGYYYFTLPEKFVLNHFPTLSQDQLLLKSIKYEFFRKGPLLHTSFLKDSITEVIPYEAVQKVKMGDTLKIRLKTNVQSAIICAWSESRKVDYNEYVVQQGGWLELKYPISAIGVYDLHIAYCDRVNSNALLTYRLEVSETEKKK
jgi:transglutaminase/protease-like cytokinesis protein 3